MWQYCRSIVSVNVFHIHLLEEMSDLLHAKIEFWGGQKFETVHAPSQHWVLTHTQGGYDIMHVVT